MMLHPLNVVKKLPVFLLVHAIAITALAQVYNSSISSATGGTGRAAVESADAAFLNPSTLVHLQGHSLYTSFAENEFAISVSDNSEDNFLPTALSYVQKKSFVSQGDLKQHDISLSLAEFIVKKWALGITGHYLEQSLPQESYRQTNADIGLMYTPKAHIGYAVVAYNIFGEQSNIPENFRSKSSIGAGFNYIYQTAARFRLDATSDSIFMAGVETYVSRFFITRIGYSTDTDDERSLFTVGLGFKGPRFVINYAYQGNPQLSGDYRHSVDLEIPF